MAAEPSIPETPQTPDTPQDLSQLTIAGFANNPLYSNIALLDHGVPAPNFNYRWNVYLNRWEPMARDSEDLLTHRLLSGVREDLKRIEIDVEIDSDIEAHRLLSGTNSILEGVRQDLKAIEIDVEIDSDTQTHSLLSGVIDLLELLDTHDEETHRLLNSISGETKSFADKNKEQLDQVILELNEHGQENERLLGNVSGIIDLYGQENSDLLEEGISNDFKTHELLSGVIASTNLQGEENEKLLDGISGLISHASEEHANLSTQSINLLEGVRQDLANIHIDVEVDSDIHTHELLSGVISSIDSRASENSSLLQGIQNELENIHIDVALDSDTESHQLLSGIINTVNDRGEQNEILTSGTNDILENILGNLPSGLEELSEIPRLQQSGITLLDEIKSKLYWKSTTKTLTQKIEEDFILMEDIPEEQRYGESADICFGTNTELKNELFTSYFPNARRVYSEPETGHPNYFIHAEHSNPDRCAESYSTFHSDTELSLRFENESAGKLNSYSLSGLENLYTEGELEYVTIYNESNYPILFHCGESSDNINKNDDMLSLQPENAVKIASSKADKIFIKRPYTISGFNVKYAITYKTPE